MLKPLLIGGCPRSGTTALLFLLNSDPRVVISSEEDLPSLAARLHEDLGTRERQIAKRGVGVGRELSLREQWPPGGTDPYHFTAAFLGPMVSHLYRLHHQELGREGKPSLIGDKLPRYYERLDAILGRKDHGLAFRYLHLSRNPFDVVNSMLRRTEKTRQGKDYWKAITDPAAMIASWNAAVVAIHRWRDHPRALHVLYEDLVFRREATLSRIANFIGIELECPYPLVEEESAHFSRDHLSDAHRAKIEAECDFLRYRECITQAGLSPTDPRYLY